MINEKHKHYSIAMGYFQMSKIYEMTHNDPEFRNVNIELLKGMRRLMQDEIENLKQEENHSIERST